jgi:hypothetical protein
MELKGDRPEHRGTIADLEEGGREPRGTVLKLKFFNGYQDIMPHTWLD